MVNNGLRVDLYSKLIPKIIQEDLKHGVDSYINFWDDPLHEWDDGSFWDELGLLPVIKNLFLVDVDKCPEKFLPFLAESLGHSLEEQLSASAKREVIKSIIELNKSRGRAISWRAFYKMLGFTINAIPLFKKNINEANDQYNRTRTISHDVIDEQIGLLGATSFSGNFANPPIVPGTIRINTGNSIIRDNAEFGNRKFGNFVGEEVVSGAVNYAQGKFSLQIANPAASNVLVSYAQIDNEFPYQAARVDLEVFFADVEEVAFDETTLRKILSRLEDVRPIHVLVRIVVLILHTPEILQDFVHDGPPPFVDIIKDIRDDEYRLYMGDAGVLDSDDILKIENDLVPQDRTIVLDDTTSFLQYPDTLKIERSDAPTTYW